MARRSATAATRTAAPSHRPVPRRQPTRSAPARRASGPARVVALPLRIARAPVGKRAAGVADSLLHGRGWIALVAVLLVGIVFFNVDLLQMNREIARTAERSATVKRENAMLKLRVARLASTERIQRTARDRGLVLPAPGQIRYLRADPRADGRRAARRIRAPGEGRASVPVPAAPAPTQPAAVQPQAQPEPPPPTQPAAPQPQAQSQPAPQPQPQPGVGAPTAPAGVGQ